MESLSITVEGRREPVDRGGKGEPLMKRRMHAGLALGILGLGSLLGVRTVLAEGGKEATDLLQLMQDLNDVLKPQWLDYRVEQIELLTIGQGQPVARIHQRDFRWVSGDPRRDAQGDTLTYLVDPSWGAATSGGVSQPDTEAAIDRAMGRWATAGCLDFPVIKREFPGGDVTIFDYFLDRGEFGDPFAADIVHAGWLSEDSGLLDSDVLGISVTFIFVDPATGEPTDLDGDNRLDTALNEIYFNDRFRWALSGAGEAGPDEPVDLETVVLHEAGHALGVGHFGAPPQAVMNPTYTGPRRELYPIDLAGLCSVWGGW